MTNKAVREWMKVLVIAIALASLVRYFIFAPIIVEGESMLPTLQDQNRLVINKLSKDISDLTRFDIVVFTGKNKDYIKRVIGMPGETIKYKDDQLYINGERISEPYLESYKKRLGPFDQFTNDFEINVPKGSIFLLGDNRLYSMDSRHIGPIHSGLLLGKASVVYWPIEEFRIIK